MKGQSTQYPPVIQRLLGLAGFETDTDDWLIGAESSIEYLEENAGAEEIVIYASLSHVLIHAVLAPLRNLKQLDTAELGRGFIASDSAWAIEHASGGGKPDRVYLVPPLRGEGATVKGGEKLVYVRRWAGSKRPSIEISQKVAHALDLYFVEERNAYCRLDEFGDIEEISKIYDTTDPSGASVLAITIKGRELFEFARLADMGLYVFFDFTRFISGSFHGWSESVVRDRFGKRDPQLFYDGFVQSGVGSFVNGRQVVIPPITKRGIVHRYKKRVNPRQRRYADFKAIDLRTGERIEASCNPERLSNYFEPESDRPLEMSPVFFRGEVLHKYKADPAKYELRDRSINCRGAWHLQTYDVNQAGEVHTYLRYLAYLPYEEQLYWQSFNIWPKGSISKRAFRTDFLGDWDRDYDPLDAVKRKVAELDASPPPWWNVRGNELRRIVHYPVTNSESEWADAILGLDQLVIEGFQEKSLRGIASGLGRAPEASWRSMKLLEEVLVGKGVPADEAQQTIEVFRTIHALRTIVKGHAAPRKKADAAKAAHRDYGTFRDHFTALAADCDQALSLVIDTMGARS